LRISDIKKISQDDIQEEYLVFSQQKTRGMERLKLSETALEIVQSQLNEYSGQDYLFNLIADVHTNAQIKTWAKRAKLNKKVTWHVGRHTFATLALTYGNDLYTISKLLGHREIKTTQIYATLIDKKKDEAIDKLPKI